MDISAAALPPRSGAYTRQDEAHPLFPLYRQYRSAMAFKLVNSSDFRDWLHQHERALESDRWAAKPEYPAFLAWMRDTQAGRRKCCPTRDNPGGLCFPHNFAFWIEGGRW